MFGLMGVARMSGQPNAFSPLSLFAASEQGAWYDPSDFSSMFQDAAGTTPVTAVEQPVGLILDKRLGLALGAELLTNGDFSNGTTGWEAWNVNAQISVSGGQMTVTQPVGGNQVGVGNSAPFTTVVGRTYMVQLDIISYVGSNAPQIRIGYFNGSAAVNMLFAAGTGTRYAYFVATATSTHVNVATSSDAGSTITFDNISVREIAGNHATQATAAARPVVSARVNWATHSDDITNAVWSAVGGATKTATGVTFSGVGGDSLEQFAEPPGGTSGITSTVSMVVSCASGTVGFRIKNTHSSVVDYYGPELVATTTPTRVSFTQVFGASAGNGYVTVGVWNSATSPNSGTLIITDVQIEIGPAATRYQRVTTASDYDTVGFPHYLLFDGVDDSLQSAAVDLTGTDKISLFNAIKNAQDTSFTVVMCNGNSNITAGSFQFSAPVDGDDVWVCMNGSQLSARRFSSLSILSTAVYSSALDLRGTGWPATLRKNGVAQVQVGSENGSADAGTGNYGNLPLRVGMRSDGAAPYNGRIYQVVLLGRTATADEITATEAYIASKSGVVL